uniref:Putative ovule protein n=1 Tax=Solanum chacoense TaxID=4108 RepID=A0A0V0I8U5_SOLCH
MSPPFHLLHSQTSVMVSATCLATSVIFMDGHLTLSKASNINNQVKTLILYSTGKVIKASFYVSVILARFVEDDTNRQHSSPTS